MSGSAHGELVSTLKKVSANYSELSRLFGRLAALLEAERAAATGTDGSSEIQAQAAGLYPITAAGATGEATLAERECEPDLLAFLHAKGIQILNEQPVTEEERGLVRIASFIASKYPNVRKLLDAIKRAQSSGSTIRLSLGGCPEKELSDTVQLAHLAYQAGLIPQFQYARGARRLFCRPPTSPLAINFFTGQWLELYAFSVAADMALALRVPHQVQFRVQVRLPNEDQFDLDVVLLLRSDELVWIEAKTTEAFAEHLHKYQKISQMLCKSPRHAILLWPAYSPTNPLHATRGKVARMSLQSLDSFGDALTSLMLQLENGDAT